MTTRKRPRTSLKPLQLAANAAELSMAVPQVVAHRVTRMMMAAAAGPTLSPRDRAEFGGMVAEKPAAFLQAGLAMWAEAFKLQQRWALSAWSLAWSPAAAWRPGAAAGRLLQAQQAAAVALAGKGLAPVHRKAVANAKRLATTRLR